MSIEIKIASLPESVEEGTLMTWYKKVGDTVARDEKVADVETDKVVLEIASSEAGTIRSIEKKEGAAVVQGDVICVVEPGAAAESRATPEPVEETPAPDDAPAPESERWSQPEAPAAAPPIEPVSEENRDLSQLPISPAARKLMTEHNIVPEHVMGSGRGGRVTKADVMRHIEAAASNSESAEPEPIPAERPAPISDVNAEAGSGIVPRGERRVPMSRIRARIAERLVEAQQTAAILTTFNEVDMSSVMNLRQNYREEFEQRHGVRLGFMSFFTKASVDAMKMYPLINASMEGSDIVYHDYYDVGVAISSPRGLVVPILRDADNMSFAAIEQQIAAYAEQAAADKLSIQDLQGGTFTITNGGIFGSMLSTPILNPPQSAILGMHKIQSRPVAVDGEVQIRPMMYLALSYDHRLVDGREAVSFLVTIKENLENPARLLLGL